MAPLPAADLKFPNWSKAALRESSMWPFCRFCFDATALFAMFVFVVYVRSFCYVFLRHFKGGFSRSTASRAEWEALVPHASLFKLQASGRGRDNWRQLARSLRAKMQFGHCKASTCIIRSPPSKEYCSRESSSVMEFHEPGFRHLSVHLLQNPVWKQRPAG